MEKKKESKWEKRASAIFALIGISLIFIAMMLYASKCDKMLFG